jgi:NAD-dependent SIR2 family protein deacetylase
LGDYASKAKNSIVTGMKKIGSYYQVQPTYAHHVLVKMNEEGFLHHYVQQNHDGLPQKAGFPQEKINEIHGAWYDPSNPGKTKLFFLKFKKSIQNFFFLVIKFGNNLRTDNYEWMLEMEEKADFCLCLGTSLSGFYLFIFFIFFYFFERNEC